MWAWGFQGVDFQAVLHLICNLYNLYRKHSLLQSIPQTKHRNTLRQSQMHWDHALATKQMKYIAEVLTQHHPSATF